MDTVMREINAALKTTKWKEQAVIKELGPLTEEFEVDEENYDKDSLQFEDCLRPEKVCEARAEELRELERRVLAFTDVQECLDKTGKPPFGVRWDDVHNATVGARQVGHRNGGRGVEADESGR